MIIFAVIFLWMLLACIPLILGVWFFSQVNNQEDIEKFKNTKIYDKDLITKQTYLGDNNEY